MESAVRAGGPFLASIFSPCQGTGARKVLAAYNKFKDWAIAVEGGPQGNVLRRWRVPGESELLTAALRRFGMTRSVGEAFYGTTQVVPFPKVRLL